MVLIRAFLIRAVGCVVLLCVGGCAGNVVFPDAELQAGLDVVRYVHAQHLDSLYEVGTSQFNQLIDSAIVAQMASLLPDTLGSVVPFSIEIVDDPDDVTITRLRFDIEGDTSQIMATIEFQGTFEHSTAEVSGVRFQTVLPAALAALDFTLSDKSFGHYLFLLMMVASTGFIIVTLVKALRSRVPRKYVWALFIFFGVFQFTLNWHSGSLAVQPISAVILGSMFFKPTYQAWLLSTSVPLGAILFVLSQRRFAKRQAAAIASVGSTTAVESVESV